MLRRSARGSEQVEKAASGSLTFAPLWLLRCVRSCALRGALRSAKLRLWETTNCFSAVSQRQGECLLCLSSYCYEISITNYFVWPSE